MTAVVIGGVVAIVFARQNRPGRPEAPEGVQTFDVTSADHVAGPVDYPQTPPVGGPHADIWQNCGFYDEPVVAEHAVHSMEHGAVWITHDPSLPDDQVDDLRGLASQTYVLVSPWDRGDLPSPIVASAWGSQLEVASTADPALEAFVAAFRNGPQTPEPGATCGNGIGTPA